MRQTNNNAQSCPIGLGGQAGANTGNKGEYCAPCDHNPDTITLSITEYEQMRKDAERWKKVKYYGYFRLGNAFTTKTLFNEKAEEYIDSLSIDQAIAKYKQ